MMFELVIICLISLMFPFILIFNILVWFRYDSYVRWVQGAYDRMERIGFPFSSCFKSYVAKSSHKWLARSVLFFMLLISASSFLMLWLALVELTKNLQ
ncbi:MAG: hypothetical protein R6X34_29135 [Chloroflexota bacterium]